VITSCNVTGYGNGFLGCTSVSGGDTGGVTLLAGTKGPTDNAGSTPLGGTTHSKKLTGTVIVNTGSGINLRTSGISWSEGGHSYVLNIAITCQPLT